MGLLLSRSVEIQISNNTQNITLTNPRTYFNCGFCSHFFLPELSLAPVTPVTSWVASPFWGVLGILVYEAKSFPLAIHFSNPIDYKKLSMELGLELSPGKARLGRLGDTYTRMANGTYSSSRLDIKFDRGVVGKSHRTVQVSDGPITVTATMSSAISSLLRVVLEEQGGSGEEAQREDPC